MSGYLLDYVGNATKEDTVVVPEQFEGQRVTQIGSGAFMNCKAGKVILPDTIAFIYENAFAGYDGEVEMDGTINSIDLDAFKDSYATQIYRDIPVTEKIYRQMKAMGTAVKENGKDHLYIIPQIPEDELPEMVVHMWNNNLSNHMAGWSNGKLIKQLLEDPNLPAIMLRSRGSVNSNSIDYIQNLEVLSLHGEDYGVIPEFNLFRECFAGKNVSKQVIPFPEQEAINDKLSQGDADDLFSKEISLCLLDDSKTTSNGMDKKITLQVRIRRIFWQNAVPIRMNGKQYLMYVRYYFCYSPFSFNRSKTYPTVYRNEIAIFRDGELVKDRKEAAQIYGKFRLLEML